MSALAVAWAWDQEARQNAKLLLLLLADNADRYGYVSKTIIPDATEACGLGLESVKNHLRSLEQHGYLTKLDENGFRLQLDMLPKKKTLRLGRQY